MNKKEVAIQLAIVVVGGIIAYVAVQLYTKWQAKRLGQDHAEVETTKLAA